MSIKRTVSALAVTLALMAAVSLSYAAEGRYEVWAVDQAADSDGDATQGILYVFRGNDEQYKQGTATITHTIDLHDAAAAAFGSEAGGKKPHMALFNTGASHMIIGHAASGHVYAIDAETKAIADVVAPGGNSHAAIPAPSNEFIVVADLSGFTIHKVETNYEGGNGKIFGAVKSLRVNGKPVCPMITADNRYAYVTLAPGPLTAGGLDIVDLQTMTIVHNYSDEEVGPRACGGVQRDDIVFVTSGDADPQVTDFVYAFNNAQLPAKPEIYTIPRTGNDSHDMLLVGDYLWVANRASNTFNVYDVATSPFDADANPADRLRLVNVIDLQGEPLGDPAPDLVDISPSGKLIFVAQRGPKPISANNAKFNNAKGNSPGVGVVEVMADGKDGRSVAHYGLSHVVSGVQEADIHAVHVRK